MADMPKRVLLVLGWLNRGGAETLAMNIYRHIDRTKLQFDFVIHTFATCDYDAEVESLGGRIYRFPRYNVKNHFAYQKCWEDFFRNHPEYTVIHAHMTGSASVFLPIAKKYGLYTVSHSHIAKSQAGLRQKVVDLYRFPLKYISDYMFACSDIAGEWMFGKNFSRLPNVRIIKNGIDLDTFSYSPEKRQRIRKEFGIPDDAFVVGNVARFHVQKNHAFLVEIFASLVKKQHNARLILVGTGVKVDEVKQQVENLHIADKVVFAGIREDTDEILSAMDVFCLPSFREGLPVTLVEAQGAGLPIVCTDTISKEICMTDLVHQLSLAQSADAWADEILSYQHKARENTSKQLAECGYDIASTAKYLQDFYLDKCR